MFAGIYDSSSALSQLAFLTFSLFVSANWVKLNKFKLKALPGTIL
jgi:hypothetical protein